MNNEIRFESVASTDLAAWIDTKKACYKEYVDQYYGGWKDDQQEKLNSITFEKSMQMHYFKKITLNGSTVGFMGYDEQEDRITGITIHMYEHARNQGVGSRFLRQIIHRCNETGKSAYLKVFKTNPAQHLYSRFGFTVYDQTESHLLMKYTPEQ